MSHRGSLSRHPGCRTCIENLLYWEEALKKLCGAASCGTTASCTIAGELTSIYSNLAFLTPCTPIHRLSLSSGRPSLAADGDCDLDPPWIAPGPGQFRLASSPIFGMRVRLSAIWTNGKLFTSVLLYTSAHLEFVCSSRPVISEAGDISVGCTLGTAFARFRE